MSLCNDLWTPLYSLCALFGQLTLEVNICCSLKSGTLKVRKKQHCESQTFITQTESGVFCQRETLIGHKETSGTQSLLES